MLICSIRSSKPRNYSTSLSPLQYLSSHKPITNPLYNFLPQSNNPNNVVALICSRDYAAMLLRHHTVSLNSISSFYTEHQKSPFAHQPWESGSLRFQFILGGSPPSPWEHFQSNRKILAVIGICHCPGDSQVTPYFLNFRALSNLNYFIVTSPSVAAA